MPFDERDREFERALHRHLSGENRFAQCPDADTLGAFHANTLSPEETAHWKSHISDCQRCLKTLSLLQATAALEEYREPVDVLLSDAMAPMPLESLEMPADSLQPPELLRRSMPAKSIRMQPAEPAAKPIPSRSSWLAPALGIAAAAVLGISLYELWPNRSSTPESKKIAEYRAAEAPPSPASNSATPPAEQRDTPDNAARELTRQQSLAKSDLGEPPKRGAATDVIQASDAMRAKKAPAAVTPAPAAAGAVSGAPTQSPRTDANANAVAAENAIIAANAPATTAPPPPAASPLQVAAAPAPPNDQKAMGNLTAALEETKPARAAKDKSKRAESLAYTNAQPGGVSLLRSLANSDAHYIAAPGDQIGWRLGPQGSVETTANGGLSWLKQSSGVTTELTAGSAPSANVAWLVGKSGVILRTSDGGLHWARLASPIADDLGGIHAADAQHASIWSRDNRLSFQTSDGGATWSRTANE